MVSAWNLHIMFPLKQVHKSRGGGGRHKSGEGAGGDTPPSIGCESEPQKLRVLV